MKGFVLTIKFARNQSDVWCLNIDFKRGCVMRYCVML